LPVVNSGGTVSHKYKEGKFQAKIVGITIEKNRDHARGNGFFFGT
jgi:hypothetical protein